MNRLVNPMACRLVNRLVLPLVPLLVLPLVLSLVPLLVHWVVFPLVCWLVHVVVCLVADRLSCRMVDGGGIGAGVLGWMGAGCGGTNVDREKIALYVPVGCIHVDVGAGVFLKQLCG